LSILGFPSVITRIKSVAVFLNLLGVTTKMPMVKNRGFRQAGSSAFRHCNKVISAFFAILTVLLSSLVLFSCGSSDNPLTLPKQLNVGVLPDESPEQIRQRYQPLLSYLAATLKIKIELIPVQSYDDLLKKFGAGEIDLVNFGGATYVQARKQYNAIPLVTRDLDRRCSSYILVNADIGAKSLLDLQDKPFAFGSRQSTSGHFMPRYFLKEMDIVPEQFFQTIVYSGAHDATAMLVQKGEVAAGAVNASLIDRMYADGRLDSNRVNILWESPPYVDYVWAVQSKISPDFAIQIRNAFLALSTDDPEQLNVLRSLNANYFLPALDSDYVALSQVVHADNNRD